MKLTGKLLSLCLGPLLIIGIISVSGLIWSYQHVESAISKDNAKITAALEMELDNRKVVQALLHYIAYQEKNDIDLYKKNISQFKSTLQYYASEKLNAEEQQYLYQLKEHFANFTQLSDGLIAAENQQILMLTNTDNILNQRLEPLLNNQWEKLLNQNQLNDNTKYKILLELAVSLYKSILATHTYIIKLNPNSSSYIEGNHHNMIILLKKLLLLSPSNDEKLLLESLKIYYEKIHLNINKIISLEDSKTNKVNTLLHISRQMDDLLANKIYQMAKQDLSQSQQEVIVFDCLLIAFIIIVILLSIFIVWWLAKRLLLKPIRNIKRVADAVAKGDIEQNVDVYSKDELGELASSFRQLVENIQSLAKASMELGKGKFDTNITPRSKRDILSKSLLEMRNNLKRLDANNKKQIWTKTQVSNVTQAVQGIRNLKELLQTVTHELANILHIGYCVFFIVEQSSDPKIKDKLTLQTSYGYKERKNLSNHFKMGEGIIGQCALEKKMITLSEIPDDYIKITSGLGEKKPKVIVAIPVIYEKTLLGVFELASFQLLNQEQKEFLNTVLANLAIIINNVKAHQRTEDLLKKSQKLTEGLQAQQEELRVANEELEKKTKVLKDSEETLKIQGDELQAANAELEEKTEHLEQQNQNIEKQNKEIEQARKDIEQRAHDLALASKYKSEFLANMSHELRTPLNSLLILSKNLSQNKQSNLNDKQVESAKIIYKGGQQLLRLINDILDLSKVEAGKLHIEIDKMNIKNFCAEIKSQFMPLIAERQLDFTIKIDEKLPETINTDEQRVAQIIRNLISNAIKFTHHGSVKLIISIDKYNAQLITFTVSDTGIGIPTEKQCGIFAAFQQADGSTSRQYGGTGLGLAISKAMAELLGGTIKLQSEPDKGSDFILSLPLNCTTTTSRDDRQSKAIKNTTLIQPDQYHQTKIENENENDNKMRDVSTKIFLDDDRRIIEPLSKSILIVEDDKAFAEILLNTARTKGFQCLVAGTGQDALTLTTQYLPKAIILDLGLPDIDGTEVLQQLKSRMETRDILVHIISSREENSEVIHKDIIEFIAKPTSEETLEKTFKKIENLLSNKINKILIIEDDENSVTAIRDLISIKNVKFEIAQTATIAKQKIQLAQFDCIILDLSLPDFSGIELLKQLKAEKIQLPPLVIYTGRELTTTEHDELKSYTNSIVVKGSEPPERLLDEVSLFLHSIEENPSTENMLHNTDDMLKGKKILLVDDDMRNVFALSSALEEYGLEIIIAANGKIALDKLHNESNIELVLMDIMMPIMDGFTAIRTIREDEKLKKLPVIALTAKAMAGDREKCIAAGASDYINKPVDVEQLLSIIKLWLFKK